jgi:drug/metabolite transporter (DMT)-like permease
MTGTTPAGDRRTLTDRLTATPVVVVALWTVWSTAFIAIKVGLGIASPAAFTLMRVMAALVALFTLVLLRGGPRRLRDRRLHRHGVLLGATNVVGFLVFQNLGLADAPVGVGSVLIYTQPFLVALGAWCFLHERLTVVQVAGMVIGWLGVVLVVASELDLGSTPAISVVWLLLSALSWAIGTILFKRVPSDVSVLDLLLVMNAYGALPIAVMVLVESGYVDWGVTAVLSMLWAGAGASVGGLGLQFVLLRRGQAAVVSTWIFAVPVLAAALGVLVLDETAHLALLLGGAAVATGIYLVNTRRRG